MSAADRFAQRVFRIAGIYGLLVLLPQYFLEARIGREFPPPITHAEYFYGFIGVAVAWQFVFLIISRDVRRYRLLMLPAILEKLSFGVPALLFYATGRAPAQIAAGGAIDLVLGTLFALSFLRTRDAAT